MQILVDFGEQLDDLRNHFAGSCAKQRRGQGCDELALGVAERIGRKELRKHASRVATDERIAAFIQRS